MSEDTALVAMGPHPYEHLTYETYTLLDAPLQRKLDRLDEDIYVPWQLAEDAIDELDRLYRMPDGTRRPLMLIPGGSGMGKSTIVIEFFRRQGIDLKTRIGRSGRREILLVSFAGIESCDQFLIRILRTLGEPVPGSRESKKNGLLDLVAAALLRNPRKLDIFEQCQCLSTLANKEVDKICDALLHIGDTTNRPMVMLGSGDAEIPLHRSAHLLTRIERYPLTAWQDLEALRNFLAGLLAYIPLRSPSPITDDRSLLKLIEWTEGVTEFKVKSLRRAARVALRNSLPCISFELLSGHQVKPEAYIPPEKRGEKA